MALWAMTILSLYIRVQVNILGRHLYLDTARDYESSLLLVRTVINYWIMLFLFIIYISDAIFMLRIAKHKLFMQLCLPSTMLLKLWTLIFIYGFLKDVRSWQWYIRCHSWLISASAISYSSFSMLCPGTHVSFAWRCASQSRFVHTWLINSK